MSNSTHYCTAFLEGTMNHAIKVLCGIAPATTEEWDDALSIMFASPIDYIIKEYDLPIDMAKLRLVLLTRMIKRLTHEGRWDDVRLRERLLRGYSENK